MKGDIIPDGEFLYRFVKKESFPEDQTEIPFGIFQDESLSCDWAAYQENPEYSYHVKEGKNVILKISVCSEVRYPCNPERPTQKQPAWEQKIVHDPIAKGEDLSHPEIENQSHSLVSGKKKAHITKAIARNSVIYKVVTAEELQRLEMIKANRIKIKEPEYQWGPALIFSIIAILVIFLIIVFVR